MVFGFPYLDTLKICQRSEWGPGVHFMGRGDTKDMQALEKLLQKEEISGIFTGTLHVEGRIGCSCESLDRLFMLKDPITPVVVDLPSPPPPVPIRPLPFTEFPSNPLLQVPDLKHLVELGRRYNFPVVVDDTVGNVHNLNLTGGSHGADVVVSSLTKLFSGKGA